MNEEREKYHVVLRTPDQRPEAPASANVRFSLEGFEWLVTIREFANETPGQTLLSKLKGVNAKLKKMGAESIFGKNAKPTMAKAEPEPEEREHWCEKHDCAFTKKTSEDGKRSWYSHYVDQTEEWCNEPKKKKS